KISNRITVELMVEGVGGMQASRFDLHAVRFAPEKKSVESELDPTDNGGFWTACRRFNFNQDVLVRIRKRRRLVAVVVVVVVVLGVVVVLAVVVVVLGVVVVGVVVVVLGVVVVDVVVVLVVLLGVVVSFVATSAAPTASLTEVNGDTASVAYFSSIDVMNPGLVVEIDISPMIELLRSSPLTLKSN
uniref:Transmembrane protein n=1 Tax=Macrostomum lignano TaxID=282301 RepID=A0A1I8H7I1_9PLAT